MKTLGIALLSILLVGATASARLGHDDLLFWKPRPPLAKLARPGYSFQRVGTFANYRNNGSAMASETVSEIVAATADGRTLVYTDSVMGAIGFTDITDPSNPKPAGKLSLAAGDEPTSVDILDNKYALVAVDSSPSYANPSGYLAVVDILARSVVHTMPLGGQPDAIKISPDRKYAAIAIENERNEDLCVGGAWTGQEVDEDVCEDGGGTPGVLPQAPAGYLVVVDLTTPNPSAWTRSDVPLVGLARYAPEDPEPEFVDINSQNHAVVTLQENNHVVIVDLQARAVVRHFPAGLVTLDCVDTVEDGDIALTGSLADVPREPDAVAWVPGANGRVNLATANEGDLFGGTRGFSIFRQDGTVAFDSGASFEELAVQHGHYPEDRSENKGTEPESIESARFGGVDYLFVGSERGSFIAVYALDQTGQPQFQQLLPAPLGPEGLLAIPSRNLLIASGEEDAPPFGVRSTMMIYQLQKGEPAYPQIVSDDSDGKPIGWSALSGLVAVPGQKDTLLAVWDSAYTTSKIFRIDASETPAVITDAVEIAGSHDYDPEGLAVAPDKTLWLASEGNASDSRQNLLVHLDSNGNVLGEVGLPAAVIACRAATTKRGTLGSGFEGVAVIRDSWNAYRLIVPQQRGWDYTTPECEDMDDDGGGLNARGEPNWTRLWVYDPDTQEWGYVVWELAAKPVNAAWVGLSEISAASWDEFVVLERDNLTGSFGALKTLVRFTVSDVADRRVSQSEKDIYDFLPLLQGTNGWITDKPEGVAIADTGHAYVVTDNDGLDGWSGESWFVSLGEYRKLFH